MQLPTMRHCLSAAIPFILSIHPTRMLSSFSRNTAYEIWKCTSSVSNAGARKGRGRRGVVRRQDLNIGQLIGHGRMKLAIPGLTTEIGTRRRMDQVTELGKDEDFDKKLNEARNRAQSFRRIAILSSERGWTGGHMGGRSVGKLESVDNNQSGFDLDAFETRILYISQKQIMTKVFGRKKRVRALVACGNGNGVVGLGSAVGNFTLPVLAKAKQRSARNLVHVYRNDENSVLHDFAASYGFAEMFVSRRGPGHGVVAHRLIKTVCELVGIKNLYAKQIGTTNPVSMANAFVIGLLNQKSYQAIADQQGLLVVRTDPRKFNFPELLAEPKDSGDEPKDQDVDFDRICIGGGRTPLLHLRSHHAQDLRFDMESYVSKYLARKVHKVRFHRKKLVETLAVDDISDEKWRYPLLAVEKSEENKVES